MLLRYVLADLIRNLRRTLSTVAGVILGIGLSCAVLFFVDGLSASMTQRAVAPLPIDMQLVLTDPITGDVHLQMVLEGNAIDGEIIQVRLELVNNGETPANEVIVRSIPGSGLSYVLGSATENGQPIVDNGENPLAKGTAKIGRNIGTVEAGETVILEYSVILSEAEYISTESFTSTFSSREILTPIAANAAKPMTLSELASQVETLENVVSTAPLSFVDLSPGSLSTTSSVDGLIRLFGFDSSYVERDDNIRLAEGSLIPGEVLISGEAANYLSVDIGDSITIDLPDGTQLDRQVSGIIDLTQARSLFSSRQGADLETFIYLPYSVIIDPTTFADEVMPAYERAITERGERVKNPPVREVDIWLNREILDAEPSIALAQTQQIAATISGLSGEQNFLLDNISNTLAVARDDAIVARRMFIFLGVPGAMLAATLAAYAGIVLAGAQRREQATLRIRGASRKHLLWMLILRVSCITLVGSAIGVALGYVSVIAVIGYSTLARATSESLVISAILGTLAGLVATGLALYITGHLAIERQINENRAKLWSQIPAWRRYRLDLAGVVIVFLATVYVIANSGFEGTPGSVYLGRAVQLSLGLLLLPLGAWIAGSFLGGRIVAGFLALSSKSSNKFTRPLVMLYKKSLKRRSWVLVDAAVIIGLIVALATNLGVFTASYDGTKSLDARYVVGADLRIIPSPTSEHVYVASDASQFEIEGVETVNPVVYGVHNVILRSNRTSEVANLAALNPETYIQIASFDDNHFSNGSADVSLNLITTQPNAILLSMEMADFLQAQVGDTIRVLLARGRAEQTEIEMEVVGLFERLPGFPDGADVLMNIAKHEETIASTIPAFFLVKASDPSDVALQTLATTFRNTFGLDGSLQIDTRNTALAKDQSSLAALNIGGLLKIDSAYALAMGTVTVAIFVFGLLLQRRREYVTLRAQGMQPRMIRTFIVAEAGTVAILGCIIGLPVGFTMAFYFINVLRPLFILNPIYVIPTGSLSIIIGSIVIATTVTSIVASVLVNRLQATELLRDE